MDKLIDIFLLISLGLIGLTLYNGCTMYNYERVKDNIIKEEIIKSGNNQQIAYIKSGIKPTDVIKITSLNNEGKVNGLAVSVDLLNASLLKSYFKTVQESPGSSFLALAVDIGAAYLVKKELEDEKGNYNQQPQYVEIINIIEINKD